MGRSIRSLRREWFHLECYLLHWILIGADLLYAFFVCGLRFFGCFVVFVVLGVLEQK